MRRSRSSTRMLDKFGAVAIAGCTFALIVFPIVTFFAPEDLSGQVEARPEPRIFWPVVTVITALLVAQNRSRLRKLTWPPHIVFLLAYLGFAGVSVLWAFSPHSSFVRFVQQVMIVTSIVLPTMLAARTVDMMRALFLLFACAVVLNLLFVLNGSTDVAVNNFKTVYLGYRGYFGTKNPLGQCSVIALLLASYEACHSGSRRVLGLVIAVIALVLIFLSDSKAALGLAFITPLLATATLVIRRTTRISAAIILMTIPICYFALSSVSNFNMDRISYMLFGDSTLTGRTVIWDFAQREIEKSPIVGWGYQSFWLVGPDAPSVTDAPGWIGNMPNAHNGYYDTKLEMGYVGLALLLAFIIATVHAIGRVADRDPARARILLSFVLYLVMSNYLESLWMRGFEVPWLVFLVVIAEIGRYWQPAPPIRVALKSRNRRSVGVRILPPVHAARPHSPLS